MLDSRNRESEGCCGLILDTEETSHPASNQVVYFCRRKILNCDGGGTGDFSKLIYFIVVCNPRVCRNSKETD